MEPTASHQPPRQPLTISEWIGWAILIVSLIVGFAMTAFAPN